MKLYFLFSSLILFACKQNQSNYSGVDPLMQLSLTANLSFEDNKIANSSLNNYCETNFQAYLYDPGEEYTNIRVSPNGKILKALPWNDGEAEYMIHIVASDGDWFKIESPIIGIDEDFNIKGHFAWVHSSVIAFDTRNYGGQEISLYTNPNDKGRRENSFNKELGGLRPLKGCGDWVFINTEIDGLTYRGWIKTKWICGNPLTNCS